MSCWGLTDGSAGMVAQVQALAHAVGVRVEMKQVNVRQPFVWLPNAIYGGTFKPLIYPKLVEGDKLAPPWPELVISCGRRAAMVAMSLRHAQRKRFNSGRQLSGKSYFIHIQDPRVPADAFDLIVAMAHDRIYGPNVIKVPYALHSITPGKLVAASDRWAPYFADYPRPWIAVLIGGSTNRYTLGEGSMEKVIADLRQVVAQSGASLLMTPSRRTGEDNRNLLKKAFAGDKRVYLYDFSGDNPYMGMLALADAVMVTDDSVNMMSEARAVGKPLYILPLPGHKATKPARFAQGLVKDGLARLWSGSLERWDLPPQNDMLVLGEEIRGRLEEYRGEGEAA